MSGQAPNAECDVEKATRICNAFIDILNDEKASPNDAVIAASFVFNVAIDMVKTPKDVEEMRSACIASLRGTVQ